MAVEEDRPSELLARAASHLREEEDAGWSAVGDRVLAAARSATRRSRPVAGTYPDGGAGLRVADLVIRKEVRRAVDELPGVRPLRVQVELAGEVLVRLRVELAVTFGTNGGVAGSAARVTARNVLDELLGTDRPGAAESVVDVVVADVDER